MLGEQGCGYYEGFTMDEMMEGTGQCRLCMRDCLYAGKSRKDVEKMKKEEMENESVKSVPDPRESL